MKYEVFYGRGEMQISEALDDLKCKVNVLLFNGWELQGGVSVLIANRYFFASQAMIKRD